MIERFEIVDSSSARPDAEQILFCDGTGGRHYRAATDMELSHWRPNKTPAEYRAGTSTEICFRFLDNPRVGSWTAAVNNHVDIDGILSIYVLVQSAHALANRRAICEAAAMGDFWGWGETPAQRVFQGVTQLIDSSGEGKGVYVEAFRRIPTLLDGTDRNVSRIDDSLAPLRQGVELVEQGRIACSLISNRLSHYVVPLEVAGDNARASYAPEFNEAISPKALLWPHVRARWDSERACLVSFERQHGWFHDLWFPGYHWADTEGLWRVPGLVYPHDMRNYVLDNAGLIAVFRELQQRESEPGHWALGGTQLPFGKEMQSAFPLVGRFVDDQQRPAVSGQSPAHVAEIFAGVLS